MKKRLASSRVIAKRRGEKTYYTPKPCPEGHFSPRYTSSGRCVTCTKAAAEKQKKGTDYNIFSRYGLRQAEYDAIREAQGNKCACCGRPFTEKRRINVDHCKKTGNVRGFLCTRCNTGLGKLGDNLRGLQRAIKYLQTGLVEYTKYIKPK